MKTTVDTSEELLARAERFAKRAGKSLSAVVEESLQATLARAGLDKDYELPDRAAVVHELASAHLNGFSIVRRSICWPSCKSSLSNRRQPASRAAAMINAS